MSNENAPREALGDDRHPIGLAIANGFATGEWIARWSHRLKSPLTEAELFDLGVRRAVKEVIAHLWSRADDPEVVEAVAIAINTTPWGATATDEAVRILGTTMSALLGPRPTEQEANQ